MMYYVIAWTGIIVLTIAGWIGVRKLMIDAEYKGWLSGYEIGERIGLREGYRRGQNGQSIEELIEGLHE